MRGGRDERRIFRCLEMLEYRMMALQLSGLRGPSGNFGANDSSYLGIAPDSMSALRLSVFTLQQLCNVGSLVCPSLRDLLDHVYGR